MHVSLQGAVCRSLITVVGLSLLVVCTTSQSQVLPYLELTGEGVGGTLYRCDDCSEAVDLNTSFPFGNYCHQTAYVSRHTCIPS